MADRERRTNRSDAALRVQRREDEAAWREQMPLRVRVHAVQDEARALAEKSGHVMLALAPVLAPLRDAALVADDAGRFVFVNRAAAQLTGYTVPELLRLSPWDMTPGDSERQIELLWRVFLEHGEQHGAYDVRRKDGSRVLAEYAALAHVLPGLHVSLLCARRPAPPPKRRSPRRTRQR